MLQIVAEDDATVKYTKYNKVNSMFCFTFDFYSISNGNKNVNYEIFWPSKIHILSCMKFMYIWE